MAEVAVTLVVEDSVEATLQVAEVDLVVPALQVTADPAHLHIVAQAHRVIRDQVLRATADLALLLTAAEAEITSALPAQVVLA